MIVREMVASGSWSSKGGESVRSWRKSDGGEVGVERWIACRDIEGYGIEMPLDVEGLKRMNRSEVTQISMPNASTSWSSSSSLCPLVAAVPLRLASAPLSIFRRTGAGSRSFAWILVVADRE